MAMKFLPIHRSMAKLLKAGHTVVHNGKGNRQGMKAIIKAVRPDQVIGFVKVKYCSTGATQEYSREWFLDNFYLFVGDIDKMGGYFNGKPFITKYSKYACTNSQLKKRQHTHAEVKALVEATEEGYTSIITDKKEEEDLDRVGTYMVLDNDGKWLGTHKTQRLAEVAASGIVKKDNKLVRIVQHVADVKPRVIVEADIERK
ncbi:hypothetical protein PV_033 (endogenous virus) [Gutovirus Vc1]|uniref:Uncharacterized protein n=1 Tax=Vibrio phage Vc1 TaxID=1480731 RepID=X2L0D3_9CAUD|nr:hypothetical protein HOQ97_gp33 [Vibrio phage Vc1]AHN84684.1 hypothetical protein PV_033 [Vibrio phage Vc1]